MLDCDCERKKDRNWYVDTTRNATTDEISGKFSLFINRAKLPLCSLVNRESSRFYNFFYSPSNDSCVLRPSYKMYSLNIWDFYLSETLETGCPYDLDIALAEHDKHLNDAELRQRSKSISTVYDDISLCLPDPFNEIRLSMQDETYKRRNSQQNYFQPQGSFSLSRISSIYGSHTYELTQISPQQYVMLVMN
ncbi:unnamed protein product [Rotaria sp. Silwood2]|nr:unnamed protein product [Rotaria sp. Silwood2]CAF3897786.1 unnamed protein product [Rotaria sp. Silwood2]